MTAAAIQQMFQQAMAFHQKGQLAEAERLYKDVLASQPKHFDALHLLGVIALQTGQNEICAKLIGAAVALNPKLAEAHSNLGNAFKNLGRFEEALSSYAKAVALKPKMAELHSNLGNILRELKRFDEALASYDKAIALKPAYADAHNNRGIVLQDLKRFEEALSSYDEALAVQPAFADAYNNRGNTLREMKRIDEALDSYTKAIVLRPNHAESHHNRGSVLTDLKRPQDAVQSYDRALALKPDYGEAYRNRGLALSELKRFADAVRSFDSAIALKPDYAEAYGDRGLAMVDLERFEDALASYDKAIALKPDYAETFNNRGLVLQELKRFDEALESHDKAVALKPDLVEGYNNKSLCLLLNGRFEQGWPLYEWRKQKPELRSLFERRSYPQPLLHEGADVRGKTLFLYWEQGFGDTIQFCRFAKQAEARGAHVIFSAQNRLHALLKTLSPAIDFIGEDETPLAFDLHSPLMSLPFAFKATEGDLQSTRYLRAEAERIQKWKQVLGNEGFKIGIAWQGSGGKIDVGRSFPVAEFYGLSQMPSVRLISLQKNRGAEQLDSLPHGMMVERLGPDFDAGADAFLDTAAVAESLDLIITSDTAIAHVAGALGRPVWVVLKELPDWRWMLGRSDTPWYPAMRLFRQKSRGDWNSAFDDVVEALASLIGIS